MQEPRDPRQQTKLVGLTHAALGVVAQWKEMIVTGRQLHLQLQDLGLVVGNIAFLNLAVDALRYSRKWLSATLGLATLLLGLNAFASRVAKFVFHFPQSLVWLGCIVTCSSLFVVLRFRRRFLDRCS
jgi:hypothetical protein